MFQDRVSRVLFPSTFVLLNIIYWLVFSDILESLHGDSDLLLYNEEWIRNLINCRKENLIFVWITRSIIKEAVRSTWTLVLENFDQKYNQSEQATWCLYKLRSYGDWRLTTLEMNEMSLFWSRTKAVLGLTEMLFICYKNLFVLFYMCFYLNVTNSSI